MNIVKYLYNLPVKCKLKNDKIYVNDFVLDLQNLEYNTELDLKISIYVNLFQFFPKVKYNFFFLKHLYPNHYYGNGIIDRIFLLEGLFRININFELFLLFVSKIKLALLLDKIRNNNQFELNENYCTYIKNQDLVIIDHNKISNVFLDQYKKINKNIEYNENYVIAKPFKIIGGNL